MPYHHYYYYRVVPRSLEVQVGYVVHMVGEVNVMSLDAPRLPGKRRCLIFMS